MVLGAGTLAQASTAAYFLGLAAILPVLREHFGLSLAGVGGLVGLISLGVASTLVPWGVAADRFSERAVMTLGLTLAALCLLAAAPLTNPLAAGALLVAAGAAGASVNAASGRVV
ncbi:MAG: MFS transporter, partial [Pseudonocardiales bacterium]|nr:MFS transporter [Pseudonocardiales bacterium]